MRAGNSGGREHLVVGRQVVAAEQVGLTGSLCYMHREDRYRPVRPLPLRARVLRLVAR